MVFTHICLYQHYKGDVVGIDKLAVTLELTVKRKSSKAKFVHNHNKKEVL